MTATQEKTATAPSRPAAPAARGTAGAAPRSLLDGLPSAQESGQVGGSTGMVVLLVLAGAVFYVAATPVATAIAAVVIGGWAVRGITGQRKARARAKELGEASAGERVERAVRSRLPGEEGGQGLGNFFWDNLAAGLGYPFGVGFYAGRDTVGGVKNLARHARSLGGRLIGRGSDGPTEGPDGDEPAAPNGPATPSAPSSPQAPAGGAAGPQTPAPPSAPSAPPADSTPGGAPGFGPTPGPRPTAGNGEHPRGPYWTGETVDGQAVAGGSDKIAAAGRRTDPIVDAEMSWGLVPIDGVTRTTPTSPTPGRDLTVSELATQRLNADHNVFDVLRYVITAATGADRAALDAGNRARTGAQQLNATSAGVAALVANAAELHIQCQAALESMRVHQEIKFDWMHAAERARTAGVSGAVVNTMLVAVAAANNIAVARAAQASSLEAAAAEMIAAAASLQRAIEHVGAAAFHANAEARHQSEYREAVIAVAAAARAKVVPFAQAREITQESLPTDDNYVAGA